VPDDSRALVPIDWDCDGDLDFITSNRSAPRVRIFENSMPRRSGSSLAVRLIGKNENRDAIGSRFELDLSGASGETFTLSRTVHGGQGFLSQGTRWLHFGIPQGAEVTGARAIWGSSGAEVIAGVEIGQFLIVRQETGRAEPWQAPRISIPLSPGSDLEPDPSPRPIVAHLERPIPLPRIPFTTLDGAKVSIPPELERPLIINLWATWCTPCVAELKSFAAAADEFNAAGADVLALCVDARPDDPEAIAQARKILTESGFPFDAGLADDRALSLLHDVHGSAFLRPSELPIPTTFIVDPGSRVFSIFQGVAEPAEMIAVLEAMRPPVKTWEHFSRPAGGRWMHGPDRIYYVRIAKEMLERGRVEEAAEFLITQRASLEAEGKKYAELLMVVGTKLLEEKATARGVELLRAAVVATPELAAARNNLAVALIQLGQGEEAAQHLLAAIASAPEFIDPKVNLARYHAAAGRNLEALSLTGQVLEAGYHPGAARVRAQIYANGGETSGLYKLFQQMVEHEPNNP
ncbi:MAG: redoxin domain-containing protein, partial [Verrucomicrobiales bacterium]